jgi:hypothetical protein
MNSSTQTYANESAKITKQTAIDFVLWLNDNVSEERESMKHIDFNGSNEDVAKSLFDVFEKQL